MQCFMVINFKKNDFNWPHNVQDICEYTSLK